MLALTNTKNKQVIDTIPEGARFKLPNGDIVSPAYDGWVSGDHILKVIAPADTTPLPVGKVEVSQNVELVNDIPTYVRVVGDAPPPPDWDALDTEALNNALVEPGSVVRALALLMLDELNTHSAKITAILNAADTATSLATFKTAMLAITDAPQRTRLQLVAALKAKIR